MPPHGLVEHSVPSSLGPLTIWAAPRMAEPDRPILLAIPASAASAEAFGALAQSLDIFADLCVLQPIPHPADAVATAVGELLEQQFAIRRVVLIGDAGGGVAALGVRASNLARVVAIEPTLITTDLWPIAAGLAQTDSYAPTGGDRGAVLDALAAPAEVVLGGVALGVQRELPQAPSLVTPAARALLAASPGVRLHRLQGAGHDLLGQAATAVLEIVLEACRRAGEPLPAQRLRLDEPLLEATPVTARRVIYRGEDAEAFSAALLRRNPAVALGPQDGADAVVLAGPPTPEQLQDAARRLRPGGHLITRWVAAPEALRAALEPHGLALCPPMDDSGTGVIRACRLAPGEALPAPLFLQNVAYASLMMDIRSRLPARALSSEPDLRVVYGTPPQDFPPLPPEQPKVLVMQRPGQLDNDVWRGLLARAIRGNWLVVIEYDDDPELVAQVQRQDAANLDRFRFAHAIQTSTPALADLFGGLNPEVLVFPNAVFDLPPFPAAPREPRVLYAALGRTSFAVEVARSLEPVITACRGVQFDVIGDRTVFGAFPTRIKRFHSHLSYEAYLSMMGQCQVTLSPLESGPRNAAKSDAKFLDAATTGALLVASPTVYGQTVQHGVNGLIAERLEDWAPMLISALNDAAAREGMTRKAWSQVRDHRMFADQIPLRRQAYQDLWVRRDALNAALIARIEGLAEAVAAT